MKKRKDNQHQKKEHPLLPRMVFMHLSELNLFLIISIYPPSVTSSRYQSRLETVHARLRMHLFQLSVQCYLTVLQFVRPHELTYKARFKAPRIPLKRPAVGPGSAEARYQDVFHQFGIDPLGQALNPALLAGFMSEMGKIYGRNMTGLTSKSQRRVGKAIRRAKMMGVIPILSKPSSHLRTWLPKRR